MNCAYLGNDAVVQVHLDHVHAVVVGADDVFHVDAVKVGQPPHLLALQIHRRTVVVVVAHDQREWLDVLAVEPLHRDGCVVHRTGCQDDDVVLGFVEQVLVAGTVEATERVVFVVPAHRILVLPVDARDAPLVVGDAVVEIENDEAHVRSRFRCEVA